MIRTLFLHLARDNEFSVGLNEVVIEALREHRNNIRIVQS